MAVHKSDYLEINGFMLDKTKNTQVHKIKFRERHLDSFNSDQIFSSHELHFGTR